MNLVEIRKIAEEIRDAGHGYDYFLQKLISFYNFRTVLECGTGGGGSSMRMSEGNDDVSIITIDRTLHPTTREHLIKHFPNIAIVEGDTGVVVEEVEKLLSGRTVDLLFLDSTHDGETAKREFDLYSKYLSDIALVTADDISLSPPMEDFWVSMIGEKIDFLYLHPQHHAGFGVSIIRNE